MAFLIPLATSALGAIGLGGIASWLSSSTILAGLARFGLGLAAKYAMGALFQPEPQAQAVQLETTYGEDLSRSVALGKIGTAGQHIYRNAYDEGNRSVQDVYILSHFRSNAIARVRYKGAWKLLGGSGDSERGFQVQDIDSEIWVKFYRGTMGQAADAGLIAKANPSNRWTSAHRGAGLAYAVVTQYLNRDHLQQPWDAFFELEGAPLYDWRKDSSIGGSGPHRWSNQDTWEFTENPVLMQYALERGIFNGTEMMVGKGVLPARLPIAEWTLAANICDEGMGNGNRYTAGVIAAAGSGISHDQNLQPLLETCAATWIEDASGEFPIVGAAQSTVLTFTDDDIMPDESFRWSRYQTKSKLINTLAGTYLAPDSFYEQTPFAIRIDAVALAEDGERLAASIPYSAVNSSFVADRLADIAFKASRFQGNGEIPIHPKYLAEAKVGRWIQWNSAEFGNRKFQIVEKRLGPFGEKGTRNIYLTLQEVGDAIFDSSAYVTVPTEPVLPGDPDYASFPANFRAAGVQIKVEGSNERRPAIRFTWNAFNDITVVAVEIEYRPIAAAVGFSLANPGVVTWIGHSLSVDDPVYFATTGVLPTGLIANTAYYVKTVLSPNTFTVTATPGGAAIATSAPQSGVHTAYQDVITKREYVPKQVAITTDGVLADTTYEYRRRIITSPPRPTLPTAWEIVTTPIATYPDVSIDLGNLQGDLTDFFKGVSASLQEARDRLALLAAASMDVGGRVIEDHSVAARNRNATAAAFTQLNATITDINGELTAVGEAIIGVQASVGLISADGLFQIRAEAGSGDVVARMVAEVRATVADVWVSAGWVMEAGFVGGNPLLPFSNFLIKADKFAVTDGTDTGVPFTFESGELKAQSARIGTAIIDLFKTSTEKTQIGSFGGGAEGLRIFV